MTEELREARAERDAIRAQLNREARERSAESNNHWWENDAVIQGGLDCVHEATALVNEIGKQTNLQADAVLEISAATRRIAAITTDEIDLSSPPTMDNPS